MSSGKSTEDSEKTSDVSLKPCDKQLVSGHSKRIKKSTKGNANKGCKHTGPCQKDEGEEDKLQINSLKYIDSDKLVQMSLSEIKAKYNFDFWSNLTNKDRKLGYLETSLQAEKIYVMEGKDFNLK